MFLRQSNLLRKAKSCETEEFSPPLTRVGANHALAVSLPTLISLAPMLGHHLDDRNTIARHQAYDLAWRFARESEIQVPSQGAPQDFFVAPLDILAFRRAGRRKFQLLELNGTGIGGITNMPNGLVLEILETIGEIGGACEGPAPLVLVASSGRETQHDGRPSHLLHEKVLFVDRIAQSLNERFGDVEILALDALVANRGWRRSLRPTVILGYTRDLVDYADAVRGAPRLFGRRVAAIVNDRFLYNLEASRGVLDADSFLPANRCYKAGADKATAYRHVNSFARDRSDKACEPVKFDVCYNVDQLIQTVVTRLRLDEQVVVKPSGTGHGDGIEFFFGDEATSVVEERIGRSLSVVRERYGEGAGFPYTVTEYLNAEVIRAPGHALRGCKYELRIVVYRRGSMLRAVPSIAKVAPEVWDPSNPSRGSLINNVSASIRGGKTSGRDHVLPLCMRETLDALDLDEDVLGGLCRWATGYVAHVLRETRRPAASL